MKFIFFSLTVFTLLTSCSKSRPVDLPHDQKVLFFETRGDKILYRNYVTDHQTFLDSDFVLVSDSVAPEYATLIRRMTIEKSLHYPIGDLGTCDISGVFAFSDLLVYCTCGTSEIIVKNDQGTEAIMLSDAAGDSLYQVIHHLKTLNSRKK
jgi:hypothetical protein